MCYTQLMSSYLIGQLVTCALIISGFFINRHLVRKAADNLAAVVTAEKQLLARLVALEKEKMEDRIRELEGRLKKLE